MKKVFEILIINLIKKESKIFMKKKSTPYTNLSKQQLLHLKELYIQKKVESMSQVELKAFVSEMISHQINDTIGKEEEMEAWNEMSSFFGDEFEIIIQGIKQKYEDNEQNQIYEEDNQKHILKLLENNKIEESKKDMWED